MQIRHLFIVQSKPIFLIFMPLVPHSLWSPNTGLLVDWAVIDRLLLIPPMGLRGICPFRDTGLVTVPVGNTVKVRCYPPVGCFPMLNGEIAKLC